VGYLAPCSLVTKLCLEYPQIKLVNIPFGPSMSYLVELKDTLPDTIKIYVGMHNILSGLALGAWGAQVTETNQVPHLCQAMVDEFVAGDVAGAAGTYAHVLRLTDVIDMGRRVSADGPKAALKALGHDVGAPRHPRVPVDDATVDKMRSAFARLGTLELEAEAAARRNARHR
jgi:dihydrodipicolinate synthase/N-acetylneuraminate lyase